MVDSRSPAASGAWDPDTQRSVINGTREKYGERKLMIEREKRRGVRNRRLRTELVDTAPRLLFLASKTLPVRLVMLHQGWTRMQTSCGSGCCESLVQDVGEGRLAEGQRKEIK